MRQRLQTSQAVAIVLVLFAVGCRAGQVPPNLTPEGKADYYKTRVIKALDLLRDTAIAANDQKPTPLISEADTRKVVNFHESTLKIMDVAGTGWKNVVTTSIDEVLNNLSASTKAQLKPYADLVKAAIQEVP